MTFNSGAERPFSIAVIGSGIAGLSAAWLLSRTHEVTLYEKEARLGGHANTIAAALSEGEVSVDTGFIVFNELNYPNFTALLAHLGVDTKATDMSFAVSLNGGRIEYSSNDLASYFGWGRNLLSPRFWSMSIDLLRFYRHATSEIARLPDAEAITLGEFLDGHGYGDAFQSDHILPEAAAIWSSSMRDMRDYPAGAFIRFFDNHGLLSLVRRPLWRTVAGCSQSYVQRLREDMGARVRAGCAVRSVRPVANGVEVRDAAGHAAHYNRVLIAAHADQALALLAEPDTLQRELLGAIRYTPNHAVLHTDGALMPQRRHTWSSWNYVGEELGRGCAVTYWMNRLQGIASTKPLFVTLNPGRAPAPSSLLWEGEFDHPSYRLDTQRAQRRLWELQGRGGIWFAGAWFGTGFHEDGLQAGLAAAEEMGAVRRPWSVYDESGRIFLPATSPAGPSILAQAA